MRKYAFFDYHSRLVSMDKPIDPKKVIHSNSYLSFWVKQENLSNGKLSQEAIDRYFDVLESPEKNILNQRTGRCMNIYLHRLMKLIRKN